MLERWIAAVLRARAAVLAVWLGVLGLGLYAATELPGLLSTSFSVPGTESERAQALLERRFNERPDGTFVVVFPVAHPSDEATVRRVRRRLDAAADAVPTAEAREPRQGGGILYGEVVTTLGLDEAKDHTERLRNALSAGGPRAYVTGQPAIQHDLDPVLSADLRRGEALALPVALAVLVAMFGISLAVAVPFVFAACSIAGALALVAVAARLSSTNSYVTNLVVLLGLGLAVDYSLLIVHRFREELEHRSDEREAVARTMATAGRAVAFSGVAVAIGLGLLVFVPVPFVRSMGLAGLLVPLVAITCALTLQPVLLSFLGRRVVRRRDAVHRSWEALGRAILRRPAIVLAGGVAVMLALAAPALGLRLSPGSFDGIPRSPESTRGLDLLRAGVGSGAVTPTHVVIDGGLEARPAVRRLVDRLTRDPEVHVVASGRRPPYVAGRGRFSRVVVAGRHEFGADETQRFVERLRNVLIPAAGFPAGTDVVVGGAPAQGVDFLDSTYGAFPWLALGVLSMTFLMLLVAFRSIVLPLQAVLLNLLTVGAVCGILVLVFQHGVGASVLGLEPAEEVMGWIPIFLFAMLFGLSMDYEMFLVLRMREAWDGSRDNAHAIVRGLERTGGIVTAAALIMAAAFSGFVVGRVSGLEQLGLGLALGVLIDATIVRMVLVPSSMAVLGRWNWWLPGRRNREAPTAPPGAERIT